MGRATGRIKADPTPGTHPELFFSGPDSVHIKDRIKIHKSEKIPREGLFVSLNGYAYLIKPGEEVDIPRPVRLMLDTRIQTESKYGEDGKVFTQDIPRITYTLIAEDVGRKPEVRQEVVRPEVLAESDGVDDSQFTDGPDPGA